MARQHYSHLLDLKVVFDAVHDGALPSADSVNAWPTTQSIIFGIRHLVY